MESMRLIIRGENINATLIKLQQEHPGLSSQPAPGVQIFFVESYFFRTNSNLMATVITSMQDQYTCDVEIVSGGGGQGLFGLDWGAEGSMLATLSGTLDRISKEHGQTITYFD